MNKTEFIVAVAEKADVSRKTTEQVVSAVLDVVRETLASGGDVKLPGFGTFEVRERSERKGRNPQTNEEMVIPAGKSPAFKAGKGLKDAVSAG